MQIHPSWLRSAVPFPGLAAFPQNAHVGGRFVGVPTASGTAAIQNDRLSRGSGGALAAMQMQHLQAMQSQAMFWMLPAMLQQLSQQLGEQGFGGSTSPGWPEQVDPQQLAMLLAYWLLSGGQLPAQGRSAGSLPSHGGAGHRVPGGGWQSRAGDTASSPRASTPGTPSRAPTGRGTSGDFLQAALAQNGDRYVFGAEAALNDANPHTFDCSELVQWAAHRAGVSIPDGSANQLAHVRRHGTEISVEEALRTPGALLFRRGHVAISLGDGRTIEARGRNYGVGIFNARGRFTAAGLVPGMRY